MEHRDHVLDRSLFEALCRTTFEVGFNRYVVAQRWDAMRQAFAEFDPDVLAVWTEADVERALDFPGVVRNTRKAHAVARNARVWLDVRARHGAVGDWLTGLAAEPEGGRATLAAHFHFLGPVGADAFVARTRDG